MRQSMSNNPRRTSSSLLPKPWSKQMNKRSHFVAVQARLAPPLPHTDWDHADRIFEALWARLARKSKEE